MKLEPWLSTRGTPVVIVTGAGGGLGLALARELKKRNAKVVGCDLKFSDTEVPEVQLVGDVTDPKFSEQVVQEAIRRFGRVDLLINNAGISHFSKFEQTELKTLSSVMNVNFWGAVHFTRSALEALKKSQGAIWTISSIAGFSPLFERTGYSASKHALHGFFSSLRSELDQHGVQITLICPSFIKTQIDPQQTRAVTGGEMTPSQMAQRICSRWQPKTWILFPTGFARLAWWVQMVFPKWYHQKMKQKMEAQAREN